MGIYAWSFCTAIMKTKIFFRLLLFPISQFESVQSDNLWHLCSCGVGVVFLMFCYAFNNKTIA